MGAASSAATAAGRRLASMGLGVLLPLAGLGSLVLLWAGLEFLRDPGGPERLLVSFYNLIGRAGEADALRERGLAAVWSKLIQAAVALLVGTGGVWLVYLLAITTVERLRPALRDRLEPFMFIGPAVAMVGLYLVFPVIGTVATSLTEGAGAAANYGRLLTDRDLPIALRNNLLWLVLGTGGSVVIGLLVAALVDRVRREALAKTFIFMPLAISMVGAAVIWRFVYAWRPPGEPQIGLVNAAVTAAGADPVAWVQTPPLNTLALIVIVIWLQTGFAMVVLSAALKGVPTEVLEAARMDGANERQLFLQVVVPMIRGSVITVTTTICIAILKVFDIVYVMTGGRFETEVLANRMFTTMFKYLDFGYASVLAVVLFVAVVPVMVVNVRNMRLRGVGR